MRQFKYIERNAKGYVEFQTPEGPVRMETGEAVEVPDSLAKKLENNNHFQEVKGADTRRGKTDPKTGESETTQASIDRAHEKKVAERHPEELASQEHPIPSDDKKTHRGR